MLRNKITKAIYYGYTEDLERRFKEHNLGNEWKVIYYEAYLSEKDARTRERKLKDYGQSRAHLKNRLNESLRLQN